MTEQPLSDYDGAWKAALDVYLQEFLELCFPAIHAAIDWSRPYHFLETELQRASSADYRGRRTVKLRLPDGLKTQFAQELRSFEEERQMTYITSIEEIGIEKGIERGRVEGRAEGLREGIVLALDLKFGEAAQPIIAEIQAITDMATLERLKAAIKPAQALDDVRRVYTPTTDSH